jgi:hypothetical protein
MGVRVRLAAGDPLREGGGGVKGGTQLVSGGESPGKTRCVPFYRWCIPSNTHSRTSPGCSGLRGGGTPGVSLRATPGLSLEPFQGIFTGPVESARGHDLRDLETHRNLGFRSVNRGRE